MRIAIVTTSWGAPWSEGVRNLARSLLSHLHSLGHSAEVIHPPIEQSHGETRRNASTWWHIRCGMNFVAQARTDLLTGGYDAAVWFTCLSSWYGLKLELLRSSGVPVVPYVTGLRRAVRGYGWPATGHRPCAVISPYFRDRYLPRAEVITPFLPLGVRRPPEFQRESRGSRRRILFLGSLESERGVECLLAALAQLDPSHHLTLAWNGGGARRRPLIDAEIERLRLGERVSWRREVDVASACSAADVLVIPRAARTKMAFPVRILEAAHMRLPLVVSDALGLDSIVGTAGRGFRVGDSAGLAHAILHLTNNDENYERALAGCEALEHTFDATQALESMRKVIEDVAA